MAEVEKAILNSEQQKIIEWLKKVRFKKNLVGGVSEQDVWKKIEELNNMYENALIAERIRYETLLENLKKEAPRSEEQIGDE